MAAPKRTDLERERDLATLGKLYLQGLPQQECARRLGVCQQQISYDLKVLQQRWQEAAAADVATKKALELGRVDHLEAVAWEAWGRSCQAGKGQVGDPRFLDKVSQCIDLRCKILGLLPTRNPGSGTIEEVTVRRYIGVDLEAV
jgi:hypothetical protein